MQRAIDGRNVLPQRVGLRPRNPLVPRSDIGVGLGDGVVDIISDTDNLVFVSAASIWEISIKQALGKLSVDGDLDAMAAEDFENLDIGFAHARLAGQLPAHHRDPFDRILIAQAKVEGLTIMTRDREYSSYGVPLMRV